MPTYDNQVVLFDLNPNKIYRMYDTFRDTLKTDTLEAITILVGMKNPRIIKYQL